MDAWWNDGERRSKVASLADTMYRAGSGDATTLPALAKLAVDRSQGLLIRASAADFIGRLGFGESLRRNNASLHEPNANVVRRGFYEGFYERSTRNPRS